MKDMARTGGGGMYGFMGSMPDQYSVSINSNHPMAQKILSAADAGRQGELAKQAYDLALLSQGMLTGADLTNFIKRSVELAGQ
jgi:molecular chaperone HtpG